MISHKFSGHLKSNLFARPDHKIFVTQFWSSSLVALIHQQFSDAGLQTIKNTSSWDECLQNLLSIGAVYLDNKRIHSDVQIDTHQVLRIHLMPKRYDVGRFNLDSALVFENDDFMVVNKPSMLPVHPMLDNEKENILSLLQRQRTEKIFAVHRLDIETSGLLIFSKNENTMVHWQTVFSSAKTEQRLITKEYRAVTTQFSGELGLQTHWMMRSEKSPKVIVEQAVDNADLVQLNIRDVKGFGTSAYSVVELELLTGKTHQIRAQLSHLGSPLVGDSLYGGPQFSSEFKHSHFLLHAFRLNVQGPDKKMYKMECQAGWENE